MAVKKVENFNVHETPATNQNEFDVETYLNANWEKTKEVVNNNAEELMQAQKDISTLKKDNKTNKSSIDVLEKSNETINKSLEDIDTKDKKQDENIKANKELIEALQTENIEIKSENERLRNDIKSIALPGEASGENIHLEDSSDARCELEISGNQKQDVRIGKNKLLNDTASMTINGVTFTKNDDGSVIANGTATDGIKYYLSKISTTIEAGIYKLSDGVNDESSTTYFTYVDCKNEDGSAYDAGNLSTVGESSKAYSEPKLIRGRIVVRKGITLSNVLFKPQLELVKSVNDVATDYEQYGASPSIDYPSPVKSIGDNVNLFPGWEMGTIDVATGNKITDPYYIRSVDFIPILPNIDYTIYSINSFGFNSLNTALRLYDKDKKYLGSQYLGEILEKNLTFKITNLDARFMIPTSTNGQTNVIPKNAKVDIKLEKGIIATPYSSYNCGSAKVDIKNENIFPNLSNKSVSDRGITLSYDGNTKEFCAKGITTAKEFYCNISFKELKYLNANKSYIFSIDNPILQNLQMQLTKYGVLANAQIDTQKKSANITQLDKAKPNSILLYSNNIAIGTKIDWTFKVQIKEGTIATNYVQHEEQSYLVDVQQEMLEGDTFVRQDGKWYEKHCWKKMLLNGTEKVGVSGASTNEILAIVYDINNAVDGFGYSNYFLYSSQVELNKMSVYNGGKNLRVNVSKMQFADSEPFKAKLKELYEAGTPVIIYYKLAEPILLECTKAQSKVLDEIYNKAHTYKNITNILVESAEVNPIICLKYLKDPETEHNKLQTQIDEIKQLLSTTETSAMLLNNMQTDLESEV